MSLTDLIKALAPEVAQSLLHAKRQRLTEALHMHNQWNPKHILILVVWNLHPLHKLWHSPKRQRIIVRFLYHIPFSQWRFFYILCFGSSKVINTSKLNKLNNKDLYKQ